MLDFGFRLRELRKLRGLTQKELAEAIGASERGIQNYEISSRKPTYDVLLALANYFDVSVDYLMGRTDQRK